MRIEYRQATSVTVNRRLGGIISLLRQLTHYYNRLTIRDLVDVVAQNNFVLVLALDVENHEQVVGMASIYFERTLLGFQARIEDVVVDAHCRGQGIGLELMELLIKEAKKRGADFIELTSADKREAALALYKRLGFEERETNVLRLKLNSA